MIALLLSLALSGTNFQAYDSVFFFGDSITWQGGYIDLLADRISKNPQTRRLKISLVKKGINGGMSNDLRDGCKNLYGCTQAPFEVILKQEKPTVVVIEIGINDLWRGKNGNPPEVYRKNLQDLVKCAKAEHIPVVLATPTAIGEKPRGQNLLDAKLDQYAAIVREVASAHQCIVADLRSKFVEYLQAHAHSDGMVAESGVLTYDGVHMLPSGNELIANEFEKAIEKALKHANRSPKNRSTKFLPMVPYPQRFNLRDGELVLKLAQIYADSKLLPQAKAFAQAVEAICSVRARLTRDPDAANILFTIRPGASSFYEIQCDKKVLVKACSQKAAGWAAAELVQLVQAKNHALTFRHGELLGYRKDIYTGLLVDVARKFHPIETLKQCVLLCWLYQINYLQLHLTDDQAFMFPSKAYPQINSSNQNGGSAYTLDELKELVAFAGARGVSIIPEFDIPGHSATLIRTMPELFKITGTKPYEHHASINFAKPEVLQAIGTVIGEMCDVFKDSPYFHMGGDEADIALADQNEDFRKAFGDLGLPEKSQQELFRRFLIQVNEIVKAKGKRLIVWEGFGRNLNSKFSIPKDVTVMEFENAYYLPNELIEDGYQVINASWTPLYVVGRHVWPAENVFDWDLGLFGRFSNLYKTTGWVRVPDVRHVIGAQVCSWEGDAFTEIQNLRRILPAMSERVSNPSITCTFENFLGRWKHTDEILEKMIHSVTITHSPLDAIDPNGFDVPCFTKPVVISLSSTAKGAIHFTIDGSDPTPQSVTYQKPFELSTTSTVRASLFDGGGHKIGYESSARFYYVAPVIKNLATGKKVTVSGGTQSPQNPELAVDGNFDLASSWWSGSSPQWLKVDLGSEIEINRIELFPYWDGSRYYQYTIETSEDDKNWSLVADKSTNKSPATEKGEEFNFSPRRARYVRVNMLHNSANAGVHIVELRVWNDKR